MRRWALPVVIFAAVFVTVFDLTGHQSLLPSSSIAVEAGGRADRSAGSDSPTVWSQGRDGSAKNAEEHWQKHGSDFPEDHDASDYEAEAQHFVTNPPPGTQTRHRSNGDTLLYDPNTNTFAVEDSAGEPRTFFRPDRGRAYWDRQRGQ